MLPSHGAWVIEAVEVTPSRDSPSRDSHFRFGIRWFSSASIAVSLVNVNKTLQRTFIMTLAFIAVLMCMAGLFGVECFKYGGCTFPQVSKDPAEKLAKAAMDRLEPLRKLNKVYVSLP